MRAKTMHNLKCRSLKVLDKQMQGAVYQYMERRCFRKCSMKGIRAEHRIILCSDSLHRALSKTTSFHILIYTVYIYILPEIISICWQECSITDVRAKYIYVCIYK